MKYTIGLLSLILASAAHAQISTGDELDFTRVTCSRYTDHGPERALEVRHSVVPPHSSLEADYFLAKLNEPLTCTESMSGETPTGIDCVGQSIDGGNIKIEIVSADGILNYGNLIINGTEFRLACHPEFAF